MKAPLDSLSVQVGTARDYDVPPLHLWHPPLSGDIAIEIDAQGNWYHEGGRITRDALVRLFASILRREEDGQYYLVTPSEKWRITVTSHALLVTDIAVLEMVGGRMLQATLNTARQVLVSAQHPLYLDKASGNIAALSLPHGLTALCTRAAWYRLIDSAEAQDGSLLLRSGDFQLSLPID